MHGLRGSHVRSERQQHRQGEGAVTLTRPLRGTLSRKRERDNAHRGPSSREAADEGRAMKVAVYGIGNILLGDDGVGPAVAHFLEDNFAFPPNVVVEDLGTPSLDLPGYLAGFDTLIFVDAVADQGVPGSIRMFSRDEITAVAPGIRISPHEPTINDALIVLDFAGDAPRDVVLIGVVPKSLEGGVTLSSEVGAAVERAAEVVLSELAARGVCVEPKLVPCAWRVAAM
ncbi:MAG TPA: hydrogenase maturation protease [Rhodanobacteraceae bacterium]